MTTTATILCLPGVWTQISTGSANVTVQGPPFGYRVAVGAAAPASTSTGPFISEADGTFIAQGLAATDNVYVVPTGTLQIAVQVLAS